LEDYNAASWMQNFVASIAGASASLIVSAPLDVVKTRIQNKNFDNPMSGGQILRDMIKNEGITSFFKGLTPKVGIVAGSKAWRANTRLVDNDWPETRLLILAGADADPSIRQSTIDSAMRWSF
jgi:hypothetical protein